MTRITPEERREIEKRSKQRKARSAGSIPKSTERLWTSSPIPSMTARSTSPFTLLTTQQEEILSQREQLASRDAEIEHLKLRSRVTLKPKEPPRVQVRLS